jgi:hypothetical protein
MNRHLQSDIHSCKKLYINGNFLAAKRSPCRKLFRIRLPKKENQVMKYGNVGIPDAAIDSTFKSFLVPAL